jgi:hypothetical protein
MTTALLWTADGGGSAVCGRAAAPDERMTADPREERRAILGVPHLDRLDVPYGGFSSGFETLAGLLQQPCRGPSPYVNSGGNSPVS